MHILNIVSYIGNSELFQANIQTIDEKSPNLDESFKFIGVAIPIERIGVDKN